MNIPNAGQKPGLVTAIALMTLLSGIINLIWGFVASATALGAVVGVVCLPITILPTILGVFEIIHAAKLMSAQPQPVQPSTSIAVLEILTFLMGNIFSMVVGILVLIFYNDVSVKKYFEHINTVQVSAPEPISPSPKLIEESQSFPLPEVIEEPQSQNLEEPEKPKRTRKPTSR